MNRLPALGVALGLVTVLGACASRATTTSSTAIVASSAAPDTNAASGSSTTAGGGSTSTAKTAVTSGAPETVVAGDIPDNVAFVAYSPASGGYTIKVPEGWARSNDGTAVVFSDKFNTIRIEKTVASNAPTAGSVTNDLVAVARSVKGYAAGKVSTVSRTAGAAILATYQSDGPANAVTNKTVRLDVERYVFWKNGTMVVVTLSSAAGSDNVDPWKTVTNGFGWV